MTTEERLQRWTAPLSAPCPDARQHPSFDAIRTETAKLESPTGGTTDWAEVLRVGDGFLSDAGRDLIVASAVASALAHREGLEGVTLGARLLARLLADTGVTPMRPRARANAILAFVARAELALDAGKDRTRTTLDPLRAALAELDACARRALADDAPSLRGLEERVRRELDAIPAPAAPTPVFAPPPPLPTALAPTPTEALPDRSEQVPAFVRRVSGQLVAAAALVRASALLDPDALRTTLVALYLPITSAPETTRDARTSLPAPSKLVLETLTKQQTSMAPEMLVRDALAALERSRFALDLHVIVARALDRAGATRAAAMHRHEVAGLFARLPELLDREFADGTRFASAETRTFFATALASTDAPASEDPLEPLRMLARSGRVADALALGSELRRGAVSGRSRFEATLAMAALAEEARVLPLASELHAELLASMDAHALDAWEPTLATAVLRALARLAPAGSEASRAAFARLCRIDARAAFEISSSVHTTPGKTGR